MTNKSSEQVKKAQINICNRALLMLNSTLINDLEENTKNASYCNLLYPIIKAEVLNNYHWKCSIAKLNLVGELNNNANNFYPYEFNLPADCLNIIAIQGVDGINSNNFLKTGLLLNAKEQNIVIIYIKNLDEELLDSNIAHLIAIKLACELCYALTLDAGLTTYLNGFYKERFLQYSNLDSKKGSSNNYNNPDELPSWIANHN